MDNNNQAQPVKIQQPPKHKVDKFSPRSRIYVRAVTGLFQKLRQRIGMFFLALFMLLPWLQYEGQQAILLDIANQRFNLFGISLFPQDLTLLAWLLIIAAFALFLITAFIGRVWCGYMCPQTVWTFIFIWFEEKLEGTRNKRIKLDQQPMSINKLLRKTAKHLCWILISLQTALSFVAYFTQADLLYINFVSFEAGFWLSFWVLFFAACTYGNAGWMREIMCTHICPYARFQSAMFDKDTFTVSYNPERGEKRGPRSRKQDPKTLELGDCIDCNLCVQVCPTGIDIRNGLQYECINCGACIDACDDVMDKMKYAKGLISYTTEHQLSGGKTHIIRPKLIGYSLVLVAMMGLFTLEILSRKPMEIDIIRDRGSLFREIFTGEIENTYTLKIVNKSQQQATFKLTTDKLPTGTKWIGDNTITVAGGKVATLPISLQIDPYLLDKPRTEFDFVLTKTDKDGSVITLHHESRFIKGI